MDITYIPMARGFISLAAVLDWFTRRVLGMAGVDHAGSRFLHRSCGRAALASRRTRNLQHRPGQPVHSSEFTKMLAARESKISMDGKGAWRDNVFVERLWRTIKYEEVNLRAYVGVSEARAGISRYLTFYNGRRPHSSLDGKTPDQAYFNQPMPKAAAA